MGQFNWPLTATLGRLDQVGGSLEAVINGLLKASGRGPAAGPKAQPREAKLYACSMTANYPASSGFLRTNGILFNHESPLCGIRTFQAVYSRR